MATNTFLWFPPGMIRITEPADEEVGGVLVFKKVPGRKILRLERTEFIAGDPGKVEPSEVIARHADENQWVLFHTHPKRDAQQYLGLSGGDLQFILIYALTDATVTAKVSHVLLAPSYIHYTILREVPFKHLLNLFEQYVVFNTGSSFEACAGEFLEGMKQLFDLTEKFVRRIGGETDDIKAMSILDAIWFAPDDWVTIFMISDAIKNNYTPGPLTKFTSWFVSQIPATHRNDPNLEQKARRDVSNVLGGKIEDAGLFYSWSMTMDRFKQGNGTMAINDGGIVYDRFVDPVIRTYDYQTQIINTLRLRNQTSMMDLGGGSRKIELKGGEVSPDVLANIAEIAQKDMEKHQIPDLTPHEPSQSVGGSVLTRRMTGGEEVSPDVLANIAEIARKDMEKHQIPDLTTHEPPQSVGGKHRPVSLPTPRIRRSSSKKRYTRRRKASRV